MTIHIPYRTGYYTFISPSFICTFVVVIKKWQISFIKWFNDSSKIITTFFILPLPLLTFNTQKKRIIWSWLFWLFGGPWDSSGVSKRKSRILTWQVTENEIWISGKGLEKEISLIYGWCVPRTVRLVFMIC